MPNTKKDEEQQWYRICRASHAAAVSNAPPITEVRGRAAAEQRLRIMTEKLSEAERKDTVFYYLDDGSAGSKLPRPPSLARQRPKVSRRGIRGNARR